MLTPAPPERQLGTVHRPRPRSAAQDCIGEPGAYVLAHRCGRRYAAGAGWRMEATPADLAPPHTAGHAPRTAPPAYGLPAYDGAEGGSRRLSGSLITILNGIVAG